VSMRMVRQAPEMGRCVCAEKRRGRGRGAGAEDEELWRGRVSVYAAEGSADAEDGGGMDDGG
jgi:hypothetical protein